MNENEFATGSVPVMVAARIYGKDASWVRAGIISGWLPIGKATRNGQLVTKIEDMNSKYGRINFYISPKRFNDDEFIDWLLTLIFKGFQIDVSYMSDEEYETCMIDTFNKLEYRNIPKEKLTGEKWMEKSVNIGDQLSQVIGIYYPYPIDNYVKYVRQQKFYGRYMDDWYIMNPSKEELENLLENVCKIAAELGIHINRKKTRIVKISSKYKFLQIKYTLTDTGKVIKRINPDRVTAMRRKLKKLAVKVENEEADYDNVENMFRGWMGGHYKLLSREQRKNLIQLYEDLFSKEITIVNKKLIVSDRSA